MRLLWVAAGATVALTACQKPAEVVCPPIPAGPDASVALAVPPPAPRPAVRPEPTVSAPHVQPLSVCDARGRLPLDAAREYADAQQFEQALSCAAQASALFPNDVLAHTERANALGALGRDEEARLGYARALALDPDSLDALLGAAHFYAVKLPSSRENDELGSLYAERGFEVARTANDFDTAVQFGRLSAMAFNDLGQAADALDRADWVMKKRPKDPEAGYERAVALFELCRFGEAKAAFLAQLADPERLAHAHHHLGLLLERDGKQAEADGHFKKAQAAAPEDFPLPVLLGAEEFQAELKKALAGLPADMRRDLTGVPVEVEDLPKSDDLTSGEPPLSPTILGLFRGPPLTEPCDELEPKPKHKTAPCRSVAIYRKNLARAVKSKDELIEQIRVTLLHEVGHLRGEDDFELAARGLE
ncbi:MAG: repeat-containing protein [Myxococcaceae bacterium]|nr:repeat-containing protein [Myxococcaceae bacterium]